MSSTYFYKKMKSPVGTLTLVASERGLSAILWQKEKIGRVRLSPLTKDESNPILTETESQLTEYFAGTRTSFSVSLDFHGTDFQKKVWKLLTKIPFGQTRTYGQIAAQLGNPKAVRAVGGANGRNPICIIAGCHRVIGSDGSLTGFAGGLKNKKFLLAIEQKN